MPDAPLPQPPLPEALSPAQLVLSLGVLGLLAALIAGSLTAWLGIVRARRAGQILVPHEPRRPVPWRLIDLAVLAACYLSFAAGLAAVLDAWRFEPISAGELWTRLQAAAPPESVGGHVGGLARRAALGPARFLGRLAASTLTNVLVLGVGIGWLRAVRGATWDDLGWNRARLRDDLRVGGVAFLALSVPVYALQAALRLVPGEWSQAKHPLVEALINTPSLPLIGLTVAAAVLVAPLVEEFLFRVVLQGWLERVWPRGERLTSAMPGAPNGPPRAIGGSGGLATPAAAPAWGPILTSAGVFAALHLGHGPDPIPLFLLAMALGWLYQRTHRIGPSLVVHFCLNGVSVGMLLVYLWMGAPGS